MSRFRIGQKVRIVSAETAYGRSFVGREGFVVSMMSGCDLDTDRPRLGYGLDICPIERHDGTWMTWADWQLEPATDSYDVVSWQDCAWKPEHLRVGV